MPLEAILSLTFRATNQKGEVTQISKRIKYPKEYGLEIFYQNIWTVGAVIAPFSFFQ